MPLLQNTDLLATDFGFCRDGNSLAGNYSTIYVIITRGPGVMKFALSYIVFQFDGLVSVAEIRKVINKVCCQNVLITIKMVSRLR